MGPLTVLVRPKKRETEKKIGRIYVPLTVSDRQLIGEVVAVGSGTQETPMEAKVGDEVEFIAVDTDKGWAAHEVELVE